uniref:Palmitoyltransferase n=1 Tax=Syphacia muris TaxID=451379 RepID=A0A0N5AQ36_9BILA
MYGLKQRISSVVDGVGESEDILHKFRNLFPRDTQDVLAVLILLLVLPLGFLIELFMGWYWRTIILFLLGVNAYLNVYKMKSIGPNGSTFELPAIMKPGFHYCYNCQINMPSRSHHCPVCDKCAFRRDHHCSFAAVCVGHFNQRYFIAAVANLWITTFVVLTWNWTFMWSRLGTLGVLQYWQILLPHLALFFRFISIYQFFCVMVFVLTATTLMFLTYLAAAQLFCLYRGQTRVEYLLDIHAYNLGFMENVRQALGRRWFLTFISPFISSPLDSDGLSFYTKQAPSVSQSTKMI